MTYSSKQFAASFVSALGDTVKNDNLNDNSDDNTGLLCPQCGDSPFGGGHLVKYDLFVNQDGRKVYYSECSVCGLVAELDPETGAIIRHDQF